MNNLFVFLGTLIIIFIAALSFMAPPQPSALYIRKLEPWPAEIGKQFPDLELIDQDGKKFHLKDFKGKPILIEFVAMGHPVSQVYAGAKQRGFFHNNQIVQKGNIESLENMFLTYLNMNFPSPEVVFIQILLYDASFKKPLLEDAKKWAKHFGFKKEKNQIVAIGTQDLRSLESYSLIPGYQLIDKDFYLQSDAAGSKAPDDLIKDLLPMVPIAIKDEKR